MSSRLADLFASQLGVFKQFNSRHKTITYRTRINIGRHTTIFHGSEFEINTRTLGLPLFSQKLFPIASKVYWRYTHKTSGFKTSGFKTSGFKTSETSGWQNVRFTKRQVYKMSVYKTSGLQNVRLQKNIHIYSVLVVGGNPQVMLQPCLQAKWWLCFIFYFWGFFVIHHHNG